MGKKRNEPEILDRRIEQDQTAARLEPEAKEEPEAAAAKPELPEAEKEYVIFAPSPVNGVIGTVSFAKGVGQTRNAWLVSWFVSHGYRVEAAA